MATRSSARAKRGNEANSRRARKPCGSLGSFIAADDIGCRRGTPVPARGRQRKRCHAANTSAGTSQTTSVQYTYSEMAGGANHSRLTSIIYPDGSRTVGYDYSGNGGVDNAISRLSKLTMGTNTLESYDYLGLGTVVRKGHSQRGVDVPTEGRAGDTRAGNEGGDQYAGLDRFGRIADQFFLTTASGTSLTSTDRFQYGYDQNSNV